MERRAARGGELDEIEGDADEEEWEEESREVEDHEPHIRRHRQNFPQCVLVMVQVIKLWMN